MCVCVCVCVCVCGVVVDGKKTYEREGCLVQSLKMIDCKRVLSYPSFLHWIFFFFNVKQRTTLAGV